MSGTIKYLLSTATVDANMAAAAAAKNMVLDATDYIAIEPLAMEGWEDLAARKLVTIFTSVNAVDAVLGKRTPPPAWKIYCLGGATYRRIASAFDEAAIAGTADSAAALAGCIRGREQEKDLYFFCGDKRRDELPRLLTAAGYRVIENVVYRTVLTPRRLERDYDGIAFFSPSAVESFFSMNEAPAATVMFSIGTTTSGSIRARCRNPVITAERPDKDRLIGTMIEYFSNHK